MCWIAANRFQPVHHETLGIPEEAQNSMDLRFLSVFQRGVQALAEAYRNLSLRAKFSLLIGLITLLVILVLSIAVLQAEKFVLREKVEDLCRLSVKNLSSVAKDNLLIHNYAPIQDVINNMVHLKLEGFQEAFALDRQGRIVAHSNPARINQVDKLRARLVEELDELSVRRQTNSSEYLQPIKIALVKNGQRSVVTIGLVGVRFSHEMIRNTLSRARRIVYGITIGVILLSLLAVNLLSKGMSADIRRLADAARRVADGDLDVTLESKSGDEIGILTREFNRMVQSLRENVEMKKYVSPLTVNMIQDQAQRGVGSLAMKKQAIAVLFSDIRGFTTISENMEPERLLEIVNVYLEMQARFIEANGGMIDKFAGDLVMAIFEGEDAVDHAVQAAVDIQRAVRDINRTRRRENLECLTVGIGINYGTAMIGSMGGKSRMDYTAIGDVVNLASKLCSFARAGHIIVTRSVIRRLKGAFSVIKMEPVKLSGRQHPVLVYRVVY